MNDNDFQIWLFKMDDEIDWYLLNIHNDIKAQLDFSEHSLALVENWLLVEFKTTRELLRPKYSRLLDCTARYLGEVYQKQLGFQWHINNTKDYAFSGIPELIHKGNLTSPICPVCSATASLDRRTGNFILGVYQTHKKRLHNASG